MIACTWRFANCLLTAHEARLLHLVVVQESLALHELVILTQAVVEEVTDAGVIGQH